MEEREREREHTTKNFFFESITTPIQKNGSGNVLYVKLLRVVFWGETIIHIYVFDDASTISRDN